MHISQYFKTKAKSNGLEEEGGECEMVKEGKREGRRGVGTWGRWTRTRTGWPGVSLPGKQGGFTLTFLKIVVIINSERADDNFGRDNFCMFSFLLSLIDARTHRASLGAATAA